MVDFTGEGEGGENSTRSTRTAESELEGAGQADEVGVVVPDLENLVLSKTLDRILLDNFGAEVLTERMASLLEERGGFRFPDL